VRLPGRESVRFHDATRALTGADPARLGQPRDRRPAV